MCWGVTDLPLPIPHDLPSPDLIATARWLVRGLIAVDADRVNLTQPGEGGGLSVEGPPPAWTAALARETPEQLAHWLPAPSLAQSRDLHLLTMATGVLLSLLTGKTELVVRGVYGAGKTQCVALLAAYFALRGHHVYYASRENTTITAMAAFVHRLLPRADDDANPVAIRLLSGPQSRTSASTPLDARDSDRNHTIWNARLVLSTI